MRDLALLALEANKHHEAAERSRQSWLDDAIEVGLALLEAQQQTPPDLWKVWVAEHLEFSYGQAACYLQVATYKDALQESGLRMYAEVRLALKTMPNRKPGRRRQEVPGLESYIRLRRAAGATWKQIADDIGVSRSYVRCVVDTSYREATRIRAREFARRQRAARRALDKQERDQLVRQAPSDVSVAYGHIRKAALALNAAGLHEAEGLCHRLEDVIVAALREKRTRI